jgi:hypothetical protein
MNSEKNSSRISWLAATGAVLVAGVVLVVPSPRVHADSSIPALPKQDYPVKFDVRGSQTDSSSPFLVYIDGVGPGVWQRLVGPVLSSSSTIPTAPGYGGGACQLEYSRDQIVIENGSSLTFDVHGLRCEDAGSPNAHATTGNYSIVAGTGGFTNPHGTGTISIETQPDGVSFLTITGGCYQGMCGLYEHK